MLCIFEGKEKIKNELGEIVQEGRGAGEIRDDIISHPQLPNPETDPSVQHKKEGRNRLMLKKETLAEAKKRIGDEHSVKHLPFDPTTVTVQDLQESIVSENIEPAPREAYISPSLKKKDGSPVTIDDFPDNFSFGNGTTANSKVILKDGTELYLTWCVLPAGANLTPVQKTNLHSIVTGQ